MEKVLPARCKVQPPPLLTKEGFGVDGEKREKGDTERKRGPIYFIKK